MCLGFEPGDSGWYADTPTFCFHSSTYLDTLNLFLLFQYHSQPQSYSLSFTLTVSISLLFSLLLSLLLPLSHYYSLTFTITNYYYLKMGQWCAWDPKLGPQDGRRRRNHGAMVTTPIYLSLLLSPSFTFTLFLSLSTTRTL